MKTKFKNNSSIECIGSDCNSRGLRSNFISCICCDIENDEFVFVEDLDMRKPMDRFIPEYFLILEGVIPK